MSPTLSTIEAVASSLQGVGPLYVHGLGGEMCARLQEGVRRFREACQVRQ